MFAIHDKVMYGQTGVCEITEICQKKFGRQTAAYYVLHPLYGEDTTIYCPVDSAPASMRALLDKREVRSLLREMPQLPAQWIENDAKRHTAQAQVLHTGDHRALMQMIKSLHIRRRERTAEGKRFHQADERALKEAEALLYREFAQVLGVEPEEIPAMLGA
ncbi:MAG TPA: CarD family transcriptional regulator [Candidatus Fimenecus excrementigallinarum]|uniref:CarD family transcriptional regulator n=1 Tax=Candidatus Fimenecus excrementigallinarum TaxID=2840816 RepID=A0A9D1LF44_9FIRM|nr:CarD family transcriptional regulator [Candidatus Fimenecus excrementigallinarum]